MKLTDLQKVVGAAIFFFLLGGSGSVYFAKQSAFAAHERSHREKALLEVIYDCETKYKDAKEGFIFDRCKDAKVEYEAEFKDKEE